MWRDDKFAVSGFVLAPPMTLLAALPKTVPPLGVLRFAFDPVDQIKRKTL